MGMGRTKRDVAETAWRLAGLGLALACDVVTRRKSLRSVGRAVHSEDAAAARRVYVEKRIVWRSFADTMVSK